MENPMVPRLSKWPFLLGDALLLSLAFLIFAQSRLPMSDWETFACTLCVIVGAGCGLLPFVLEYRVLTRFIMAEQLIAATAQIQKLEQFATQISNATGQWQTIQECADKTTQSVKEISERAATGAKEFSEFFRQANEGEKASLRLELEKLRRAETEWLQVIVRMLDHIYALHKAALRSGQPALVEQIGLFQNACREAARRVGLAPFVAEPAEGFDEQRHQTVNGDPQPLPGALVDETVATGYTFQGKILRPALVRVLNRKGENTAVPAGLASPRSIADEPRAPVESA
jgi:molecular chaperone GrpE (heat shock protein)